jgi:hypothetical protein
MRTEELKLTTELITVLGILGQAQELGADDDKLSELGARVRTAESEFRLLSGQSR